MRWPSSAARWGSLALAALLALSLAAPAHAVKQKKPQGGGGGGAGNGGATAQKPEKPLTPEETPQLESPDEVTAGETAQALDSSGQVDPISGLGIRNPVCDEIGQIRDRQTRLACKGSGSPQSNYPAGNYGIDVFVDTGITHPVGNLIWGATLAINYAWLGLTFVLEQILTLLGLAFGLNPFSGGQTMKQVSVALNRIYNRITDPWLSTLIVAGGIWFAYKGLVRREAAAGVGGTVAAVAMLVVGLWVVHQPSQSVGRLARISDELALLTISAPQSGSVSRPTGSYAEAMSSAWNRLVEVPFAGLNFSDTKWALSPPPAESVAVADSKFCDDNGALALLALLAHLGSDDAQNACAGFARKRYGKPKRIIDLYLRSSPRSPARKALWDFFDGDDHYKPKVAAQGGDGVVTRFSMLLLFALGLLGAILLLAWLAIRLFTQAAIAFVMLLAAPFALFFPMLGDSGRRAFKTWGLTLLGATVAKVVYAMFLSVVFLGITLFGKLGGATGFLLACAFAWAVFLKRAEIIGWMSIGNVDGGRGISPVAGVAALALGRGLARKAIGTPARALRGTARRGGRVLRRRGSDGAEATRQTAGGSLDEGTRKLANRRYDEAKQTVNQYEGKHGGSSSGGKSKGKKGNQEELWTPEGNGKGKGRAPTPEETERYERAKKLVDRADRNEDRHGSRWTDRDMERFKGEDQRMLRSSGNVPKGQLDHAEHAHRAGYDREQFEAMKGDQRTEAAEKIEKATKRDRRRLEVSEEKPGRVVGRPRQAAERLRQLKEGAHPQRRDALRKLRRDRRQKRHDTHRRNLSRGS